MKTSAIYGIHNTVNDTWYVGQTIDIVARKCDHFYDLRRGVHHNKHLQHSFSKYGEASFAFKVLESPVSIDSLDSRECFWIDFYHSNQRGQGYNMESGGRRNATPSPETLLKIKEALQKYRQNDDWKTHLSLMNKGKRFISEAYLKVVEERKIKTQKRADARKEKRLINYNGKVFLSAVQPYLPGIGHNVGKHFSIRHRARMSKSQKDYYLKNPRPQLNGHFVTHSKRES
jgi:group I intron endonuclease